jgi:cobyric acid synthase
VRQVCRKNTKSELNSLTHRISQRVAGFLERETLLVRDNDNDYLALDGLEDAPMLQIQGYSITYGIATGKQQGRRVFTLQTIAPIPEQGLASGCAGNVAGFSLHAGVVSNAQDRGKLERLCRNLFEESPALGYQKKVGNNDLPQGALPTQNTLP